MTPAALHDRLVGLLARLTRLAADHRLLCAAPAADKVALGATRWKIAGVGRERMELLTDTVFPLLERRCTGPDLAAVRALREASVAYRRGISDYVSRWPTAAVLADWPTYVREAETFRTTIATHVARERLLLLPILRRLAAAPADAHGRRGQLAMPAPATGAAPAA